MHARSIGQMAWALIALAMFTAAPSWAQERKYPSDDLCKREELCRRCDGPSCMKVAPEAEWPANALTTGGIYSLDAFQILLPESPERIAHPSGGGLFVRYAGKKAIAFEWIKLDQAPFLKKGGRGGELAFSDIPRIQYTKTPADAEPPVLADKRIWRFALLSKDSGFSKAQRQFHSRRGPLTLYVREGADSENHAVAHLVNEKVRNAYLQITGFGFEFDEFLRILATANVREK